MPPSLMSRETAEVPEVLARQRATLAPSLARLGAELRERAPRLVVTIARGSSDHAALYLKHLVERGLGLPCVSIGPSLASVYHARLRLPGAVAVAISQSGRSPDLLALQDAAREGGALCVALVNDEASPLAAAADLVLPLCAGPERAVAATKSMIAALAAGAALVAAWAGDAALDAALAALPDRLALADGTVSETDTGFLAASGSLFVLGRGAGLGIAAEAALKLKETCAIHAEAFSSAEVLHGPPALLAEGFPVLGFLPQDAARAGFIETLARLRAMGARTLCYDQLQADGPAGGDPPAGGGRTLLVPATAPLLAPIAMIHGFYLLAEATARRRGRDPDNPPHLSKVTRTT